LESPVSTVCLTTVQSGLTGRSPVWAWFCTALQGISEGSPKHFDSAL
jgi:hypothetical protein